MGGGGWGSELVYKSEQWVVCIHWTGVGVQSQTIKLSRSWSLFLNHVLLLQNRPRPIKPGQNRPRAIKPGQNKPRAIKHGQPTARGYFIEGSLRVKVSSFSLVLLEKCNNFFWLWCKQLMFYHYDYTKCCKNHDSMWLVIVKVYVSIGERISGYQHQIICTFLFSLICDQHTQSLIK